MHTHFQRNFIDVCVFTCLCYAADTYNHEHDVCANKQAFIARLPIPHLPSQGLMRFLWQCGELKNGYN